MIQPQRGSTGQHAERSLLRLLQLPEAVQDVFPGGDPGWILLVIRHDQDFMWSERVVAGQPLMDVTNVVDAKKQQEYVLRTCTRAKAR